ncbi:hypothetical protein N7507_005497 [Penicillium longicatenatum]|nr:hypothetical protein N7507_005497 [Penicillium longicatenatum]
MYLEATKLKLEDEGEETLPILLSFKYPEPAETKSQWTESLSNSGSDIARHGAESGETDWAKPADSDLTRQERWE